MSNRATQILQEARKVLQDELKAVDASISSLEMAQQQGNSSDNPAIAILMQGRDRLQAQLEQIEIVVTNIANIAAGKEAATKVVADDQVRPLAPGQYAGMKLSTAVQAYLSERNRGPVLLSQVVKDLTTAGVLVGKHRELPDTRDLRLLCANNRKRFQYDSHSDTIRLRTIPGNDTGRTIVQRPAEKTA